MAEQISSVVNSDVLAALNPNIQAQRRLVKQDREALARDDFGYSPAQMRAGVAEQLGAIRAGTSTAVDAAQRQAAAGGGTSGAQLANAAKVASVAGTQAGAAAGRVQQASDRFGAQRRAQALANVGRAAANAQKQADRTGAAMDTTAKTVASFFTGGVGGLSGGLATKAFGAGGAS